MVPSKTSAPGPKSLQFEEAADKYILDGQWAKAIELNFAAKTPHLERLSNFASMGHFRSVIGYIELLFNTRCADIDRSERMHLANLLANSYVNLLLETQDDIEPAPTTDQVDHVLQRLEEFLRVNTYYTEQIVIKLLVSNGLYQLAERCARLRANYACLIENLTLTVQMYAELFTGDNWTEAAKHFAEQPDFMDSFTSPTVIGAFLVRPSLLGNYLRILTNCLPFCDAPMLHRIAELFHPHSAYGQLLLNRVLPRIHSEYPSFVDSTESDLDTIGRRDVLNFFIMVLLLLYRFQKNDDIFFDPLVRSITETKSSRNVLKLQSLHKSVQAAGGQFHAAIIVDGLLYTWGKTGFGRLGIEVTDVQSEVLLRPTMVPFFSHNIAIVVRAVSCGASHTLMLTDYGLYSCGLSQHGQLGIGPDVQYSQSPCLIDTLVGQEIKAIACGQYHSLALTADGQLFSWGWGIHGQLGHGSMENCYAPMLVEYFQGTRLIEIAGGYCHSLVLDESGRVYSFGNSLFGQLGHGGCNKLSKPQQILSLPTGITHISTHYFSNLACTGDNLVYSWGAHPQTVRLLANSARRQRAKDLIAQKAAEATSAKDSSEASSPNGTSKPPKPPVFNAIDHLSPTLIGSFNPKTEIIKLAAGGTHYSLLTSNGKVFIWGRGVDGQLGHGSGCKELRQPTMLKVVVDDSYPTFVDVATGFDFTFAVDSKNRLWAWGQNSESQLGHQNTSASGRKELKIKTSRRVVTLTKSKSTETRPVMVTLPNTQECLQYCESLNYSVDIVAMKRSTDPPPPTSPSTPIDIKPVASEADQLNLLKDPSQFHMTNQQRLRISMDTLAQTLVEFRSDLDLWSLLKRCESLHAYQYAALIHEMRGDLHLALAMQLRAINLSEPTQAICRRILTCAAYILRKALQDSRAVDAIGALIDYCSQHRQIVDIKSVLLNLLNNELNSFVFGILILQSVADPGQDRALISQDPNFLLDIVTMTLERLERPAIADELTYPPVMQLIYSSKDSMMFPAERMWKNILKTITTGSSSGSDGMPITKKQLA